MRRVLPMLILLLGACAAQPPERAPLPDVEEVLPEAVGCQVNVGAPTGVLVASVSNDGAAAGLLEEGDVITRINGSPTDTRPALTELMAGLGPGESIDVEYDRKGTSGTVSVTLSENPADPTRGMIGITVQTAYETATLEELTDTLTPTATTRPIEVGETLYLFDPLANQWQSTGIDPPQDTRWVSTSSGLYSVTQGDPVQVLDLVTDQPVEDDGFDDWEPQRLVGSVGDLLIVVVTAEIADQPGFVNLAIAGFDPRSGTTAWVSPVSNEFGIPVAAYGAPDGSAFLAVGADPESGDQLGVALFDAAGVLQTSEGLDGLGSPMGWHDATSMAFRTSESIVSVHDFIDASTTTYDLPESLVGSVAATVGDGENILVVGDRDLLLQNITEPNESVPLASNCNVGRTGDPGWGA
jgi:hypothetical protein